MDEKQIDRVQFSIAGRLLVRDTLSVVKISNPKHTVEFDKNHTFHDTRMGAFRNVKCATCGGTSAECSGHFGRIELTHAVLNPLLVKTNLRRILTMVCFRCHMVTSVADPCPCCMKPNKRQKLEVTPPVEPPKNPRFIKMNNRASYNFKNAGVKLTFHYDDDHTELSLIDLYNELAAIPLTEGPKIFQVPIDGGIDMTDYCFIHHLLVLPPSSRPPTMTDGSWSPDHITRLYLDVLRASDTLRMKQRQVHKELFNEYHNILQNSVNILFDINNTTKHVKQMVLQNGGIKQRIDGKQGRLRLNLMGKRVDFSARTVASGDPNLHPNEVGIPIEVAENLTVPEMITDYNLYESQKWNIKYVYKNSIKYDTSVNPTILKDIRVGDKVDRSLKNGDIVLVNRQPTLHRGSMLACRVKIFSSKTFRMNYSSAVPLNLDNDGDELNIHVPQDVMSRSELEILMLSSTNIVCSQNSKPLMGCTQDALLGCYKLSKDMLPWIDFMSILNAIGIDIEIDRCVRHKGTEVMDEIMHHLDIEFDYLSIPKSNFVIRNSRVISGVFDKSVVGIADNSIIHHVFLSYGHQKAADFIFMLQKAATAYLDIVGFSIGIADCMVDHEELHVDELEKYVQQEIKQGIVPDEQKLTEALSSTVRLEPPSTVTPENSILATIAAGSKGSIVNFNQITRAVGQQIINNGRVPHDMKSRRTLPHFETGDIGLKAGGFVRNSYIKGLRPEEFFFHTMGGRIGMIDTSVKTADTGATQRRLVKSLERLIVVDGGDGNRLVKCSTTGNVISFDYGEDGFDGTYLKRKLIS